MKTPHIFNLVHDSPGFVAGNNFWHTLSTSILKKIKIVFWKNLFWLSQQVARNLSDGIGVKLIKTSEQMMLGTCPSSCVGYAFIPPGCLRCDNLSPDIVTTFAARLGLLVCRQHVFMKNVQLILRNKTRKVDTENLSQFLLTLRKNESFT